MKNNKISALVIAALILSPVSVVLADTTPAAATAATGTPAETMKQKHEEIVQKRAEIKKMHEENKQKRAEMRKMHEQMKQDKLSDLKSQTPAQ